MSAPNVALQLDYVDVLQCHRFDPDTPIEETMDALHDVRLLLPSSFPATLLLSILNRSSSLATLATSVSHASEPSQRLSNLRTLRDVVLLRLAIPHDAGVRQVQGTDDVHLHACVLSSFSS